jgi:hypothetical protein
MNAMTDPGRTGERLETEDGKGKNILLGRNASPAIPAERPYRSANVS